MSKQEQKSALTRERLMKATLSVIKDEGWTGATTSKICAVGGVSRGAQTHQFPTKSELINESLTMIARVYEQKLNDQMTSGDAADKSMRGFITFLWDAILDDMFMIPSMESLMAARTDPELKPLCKQLDIQAVETMRAVVSDLEDLPGPEAEMADAVELTIYLFRSLVIERGLHEDEKYKSGLFNSWMTILEKAYGI